ncbi:pentatricopeptide repeat-containing protein [Tanacetum coccineum]
MMVKNMISDSVLYSLFVYGKIKMGEVEYAREVYDEMVKSGFEANWFVHTKFIEAYCEGQKIEDGDELFRDMERVGLKPYDETYTLVERLNGRESVPYANEMLTILLDKGFVTDVNTFSYLIAGYGREGDVEGVLKLYYEIEYRNLSHGALPQKGHQGSALQLNHIEYKVVMVVVGECREGNGVHWWRRMEKVVVGRRSYGGVMMVDLQTMARPVISKEYSLEYRIHKIEMHVGAVQEKSEKIEMHVRAVQEGERALVIDNLIATEGTLCAAINLLEQVGDKVVECACVIELPKLKVAITTGSLFYSTDTIPVIRLNRYPVSTSLIHIESCKSPTAELFDVNSGRISIVTVNTKKYHFDVLARSQG